MRPDDLILRGYTVLDGDSYFSICLDMNVYARGDSPDEAEDKCLQFVCEYLNEAFDEDKESFSDLVPRRAPVGFWMRYRLMRIWGMVLHAIRQRNGNNNHTGPFKKPLPLQLAC